jgi:hypothetical protein
MKKRDNSFTSRKLKRLMNAQIFPSQCCRYGLKVAFRTINTILRVKHRLDIKMYSSFRDEDK